MKLTDIVILTASIKKSIKLTIPSRAGKTTFILKGIDPDKRIANKYAHELRRKEQGKIVKVLQRKLRDAKTYAIYISLI